MRPKFTASTRPELWVLALLLGVMGFVVGRQTAPVEFEDLRTDAATLAVQSCQLCLEADVQDLTTLQTIDELDRAICPRTDDEREVWFSARKGARVRLTGTAERGNHKQWPALTLTDGNRVFVRQDSSSDDPFAWEPGAAGHRVTVEGCISRTWYPTTDQRRAHQARLSWRRQRLQNVVVAAPSGYVYRISVANWKPAESPE